VGGRSAHPRRARRAIAWTVLAIALAGGSLAAGWGLAGRLPLPFARTGEVGVLAELGAYGEVPDFSLTERSGRAVRRADLLGTVWIANFIYTRCRESCPIQTAQLATVQREFAGAPDLRIVSITVDPEHDTPAVLTAYAERYGADPVRWLFLTGPRHAIYRLATDGFHLGVVDPDDRAGSAGVLGWVAPGPAWATHGSQGLVMHSSRLVLVDRRAWIRAYHLPDDPESLDQLRRNLRTVLGERGTPPV
jgi:protein SCO1/2